VHIAACCSVLQYDVVCCVAGGVAGDVGRIAAECAVWSYCSYVCSRVCVLVCCSVLQCVAVCCSVLQCVAVCCVAGNVAGKVGRIAGE